MAGANKVLKDGQVLFKAGDKSDGMYVIRRGELRVYLEQSGKEVALATIGAGGMIGEMALFDNQPRSASVKASQETEVTHITNDDFGKLMKQIPKWFVGLMTALSGRLRSTNERLQKLEAGGAGTGAATGKVKPYAAVLRMLNVLVLVWHKDGVKDGKDNVLQKQVAEKCLVELFGEDAEKVKALFETLVKAKLLTMRADSYKNVVFASSNRAVLGSLATFIQAWLKANPSRGSLPETALTMLKALSRLAEASPYDAITVSLADLEKEGSREGAVITTWKEDINWFKAGFEEVKVVKVSNGVGLRTNKKDIESFVRNHETLAALYKANLC